MTMKLEQQHPILMVPRVYTAAFVIYTNGNEMNGHDIAKSLQEALQNSVPSGVGVGSVSLTNHGVYEGKQGATRL